MTIRMDNKVLVSKIETTYGVDSTPVAGNAMRIVKGELSPMEGKDESRDLDRPYLGAQPTIPLDLHRKLKFSVELQGSGTAGTPPAYGPLLRACGFAETITPGTSVVYNPISTGHESVTHKFFIENTLFGMYGARGTVNFMMNSSSIPYAEFDFTSLFSMPVEGTPPVPDYSGFQAPTPVTNATTPTFTIDGESYCLNTFKLTGGNDVKPRFRVGKDTVRIGRRAELLEFQIDAVPLTDWNPFQVASDQTQLPVQIVHGTTAGKIVTLDMPAMQLQRPTDLADVDGIVEWPLRGVPIPVSGNDQLTLTFT